MITSIGFIELNSIAKGIETADDMVKAALVDLIFSKPTCPGKFIILASGDVGAVEASVKAGVAKGGSFVVNHFILSNVHKQVIPAINASTTIPTVRAAGVLEFFSIASAIIGADTAAKASDITLIEVRLGVGIGGKGFVTLCGDVSAVEVAVKAAENATKESGMLLSSCVIPSPSIEVFQQLV